MMFIRKRQSMRSASYQVIETFRENGKVRQRVLANLGRYPTVEEAIHPIRLNLAKLKRSIACNTERNERLYQRKRKGLIERQKHNEDKLARLEAVADRLKA